MALTPHNRAALAGPATGYPSRWVRQQLRKAAPCLWLWILIGLSTALAPLRGEEHASVKEHSVKEHEIKAAFIYNFLKLIEWPSNRFEKTNSPVIIGVAGHSPILAALESAVQNRGVSGRRIHVKAVRSVADARDTHLVFFGAGARAEDIIPALPKGLLTVGESSAFADADGMINFVIENEKVRFEINVDAAERANIRISAQLLKLAKNLRRKPLGSPVTP